MSIEPSSSRHARKLPSILAVLAALGGLAHPAAGQNANGWTVTWASAGQNGKEVSQYKQNGAATWQELSSTGGPFDFQETGRDESSVYLEDPSRNMWIQIDVLGRKVYYSDANNSRRELYDVLRSSTFANGFILRSVTYGQGGRWMGDFLQTGTKTWREVAASSSEGGFDFQETGRDSWTVDLYDPSRKMRIQVDLQAQKVYYSDANNPRRELYDVLSSSAEADGWLAQWVVYGQGGRSQGEFRQIGARNWREETSSGGANDFTEAGRDDWSVYLDDPSRNVRIQIDLHSRKIYYSDSKTSRRELYDVLRASW